MLTGSAVQLCPMEPGHAGALYAVWSHPEVAPWLEAPPLASAEEAELLIRQLRQLAETEDSLRWSILGPDGRVIGSCGYNYWQLPGAYRGELGCELAPEAQGRGYMREALGLALTFGFGTMGLNRVEAFCHPGNKRAQSLFAGLGFLPEGRLRQYRHTAAGFQDVLLYALLRSDRMPPSAAAAKE